MGWLELKELGTAGTVTLQSLDGMAENSAFIVRNSSTETFILENRQIGTWNPASLGSGVLVTRIAYSQYYWERNTLNNTKSQKRACVLTANGATLDFSASPANLYGNGKNSISTLKTLKKQDKDINIEKITKNTNGTITLTLGEGGDPTPEPTPDPDGAIFYESFNDCSGKGGNDGNWKDISGTPKMESDNAGWSSLNCYAADQCARVGTGKTNGSVTTPAFTLNGSAVLTFRAGAWDAKNDGIVLNLSATGGTLTPSTVEMVKGNFTDFTVNVTGTGEMTITFASTKGRFFLDEVLVKAPTPDAIDQMIANPTSSAHSSSRIYTLDGRYAGTDLRSLARGVYVINGRKVLK